MLLAKVLGNIVATQKNHRSWSNDPVRHARYWTLEAFRDHGHPRASLREGIAEARETIAALGDIGIPLRDVTDRLLEDGVRAFIVAFDALLAALDAARAVSRSTL